MAVEHDWKHKPNGEIDEFATAGFDSDGMEHGGPKCLRCGFTYCIWCRAEPDPEDRACPVE